VRKKSAEKNGQDRHSWSTYSEGWRAKKGQKKNRGTGRDHGPEGDSLARQDGPEFGSRMPEAKEEKAENRIDGSLHAKKNRKGMGVLGGLHYKPLPEKKRGKTRVGAGIEHQFEPGSKK